MTERYAESKRARDVGVAVIVTLLLAAVALGAYIARMITRGRSQAVVAFGRIQQGHFDNPIVAVGSDEVAQVLRGLDEMQSKLKEQIERDRAVAAENGRIRTALDKVSTAVMLADPQGTVIHANEAVDALFRQHANDVRRQVTGFDPVAVVGGKLDALCTGVNLATLSAAHTSESKYGAATLKFVVGPVVDASGHRLGTAAQWFDRTQEVAREEEIDLLVKAALDGDLLRRICAEGKTGFFAILARGMNGLLDNMADVVRTIKTSAVEVSGGAEEISQGNENLSQRTEEQASSS